MGANVASKDNGWSPGDLVRLRQGPYADFPGKVLSVDQTRGLVEAVVDIFGRETRVEVLRTILNIGNSDWPA